MQNIIGCMRIRIDTELLKCCKVEEPVSLPCGTLRLSQDHDVLRGHPGIFIHCLPAMHVSMHAVIPV